MHVNVRIQGFNFVKCIICQSLKDLISKLGKNNDGAKEHEMNYEYTIFTRNRVIVFTIRGDLNQSNPNIYIFVNHP